MRIGPIYSGILRIDPIYSGILRIAPFIRVWGPIYS